MKNIQFPTSHMEAENPFGLVLNAVGKFLSSELRTVHIHMYLKCSFKVVGNQSKYQFQWSDFVKGKYVATHRKRQK